MKNIKLDLTGATCASCAYTIEHMGRKIKGIDNIHVDASISKINIEYDGNPDVIDKVINIVSRLGYKATQE